MISLEQIRIANEEAGLKEIDEQSHNSEEQQDDFEAPN